MKIFTLIAVALFFISIETHAQIPNNGFETWENYIDNVGGCQPPYNVYEKPDMWNGSLPKSCATYSYSLHKNNESYPAGTGQFSLKIQADVLNGVRGVAISNDGSDPMTNWVPKPAFAINYRPESLYLYYKYIPYGGDTMFIQVYFYKNGVLIDNSYYGTTETISAWTPLKIPLTYTNPNIPDSATILFVTGAYIEHSESVLFVDNLSFTGFVTSVDKLNTENIEFILSPNPASDFVNFNVKSKTKGELTLNIYNSTGVLVKKEKIKPNQTQIHIGDLSNGMYLVEISSKELKGRQKLLIQR